MKHHILIEFEADTLPPDFTDQVAGRVYGMACVKKGDVVATIVPPMNPPLSEDHKLSIVQNWFHEPYNISRAMQLLNAIDY